MSDFEFEQATIRIGDGEPFPVEGVRITMAKPPGPERVTRLVQRVTLKATFDVPPEVMAGWMELAESLPPLVLSSADPEPPVGTRVRDDCGKVWINSGYYPCAWMPPGSKGGAWDDVETWTKIAGNYGPVTVLEWGDGPRRDDSG